MGSEEAVVGRNGKMLDNFSPLARSGDTRTHTDDRQQTEAETQLIGLLSKMAGSLLTGYN
jgi:hypothetical protein